MRHESPVTLAGVPETALITLYSRGTEARRPGGLIDDRLAAGLLASIDYPFAERFGRPDLSHVLRALLFDHQVRGFLQEHPRGTVVALGEGLETQLWRVDNGGARWISVDLPEIIDLRRRLLPAHPRNQLVPCSALDPAWTALAGPGTPTLIVAQGLLMYFTEPEVDGFFDMVAGRCPGSTMVFDTIPAWAATSAGHRQSRSYRMPPQPWGAWPAACPEDQPLASRNQRRPDCSAAARPGPRLGDPLPGRDAPAGVARTAAADGDGHHWPIRAAVMTVRSQAPPGGTAEQLIGALAGPGVPVGVVAGLWRYPMKSMAPRR